MICLLPGSLLGLILACGLSTPFLVFLFEAAQLLGWMLTWMVSGLFACSFLGAAASARSLYSFGVAGFGMGLGFLGPLAVFAGFSDGSQFQNLSLGVVLLTIYSLGIQRLMAGPVNLRAFGLVTLVVAGQAAGCISQSTRLQASWYGFWELLLFSVAAFLTLRVVNRIRPEGKSEPPPEEITGILR